MKRIDLGPTPLAYPLPAFLVGTYDSEGKANIMTVAWGGLCCSEPPCVAVSIRPGRYSHEAVIARKAFTVNVPSVALAGKVDFAGMACGKTSDKFRELGLTAEPSSFVDAPCVAQCPLILECRLFSPGSALQARRSAIRIHGSVPSSASRRPAWLR